MVEQVHEVKKVMRGLEIGTDVSMTRRCCLFTNENSGMCQAQFTFLQKNKGSESRLFSYMQPLFWVLIMSGRALKSGKEGC